MLPVHTVGSLGQLCIQLHKKRSNITQMRFSLEADSTQGFFRMPSQAVLPYHYHYIIIWPIYYGNKID